MRPCSLFLLAGAIGVAQPSIESRLLAAHNAVRAQHHLRPLNWSDKLAQVARDWAETLLSKDEFFHRPQGKYGENLFRQWGAPATPEQVVKAWAVEAEDYNYRTNTCSKACGHYTQIVWRDTTKVGCAFARVPGREVWVCNYDPRGNYVGDRPY
jgi:uncharacterized protein YkwD